MPDPVAIDALLTRDAVATALGIERLTRADGSVALSLRIAPEHLNFAGVLHGGVVFTLADTAMGIASNAGRDAALAIDAHVVFSGRAEVGDVITAEAVEVATSRRLSTYRVSLTRPDGRVLASFDGTVFRPS